MCCSGLYRQWAQPSPAQAADFLRHDGDDDASGVCPPAQLHGLGEQIVRVSRRAALRPRERSIGLLRPGEIARLNGFYELNEKLPGILRVGGLRIAGLKRGNTRHGHVVTS
jgi:hypothetical protein